MSFVTQDMLKANTDWPRDRFIKVTGPYSRRSGGTSKYLDYRFDSGKNNIPVEVKEHELNEWFKDTGFEVIKHHLVIEQYSGTLTHSLRLFEFPNKYECSLFRIRFGI